MGCGHKKGTATAYHSTKKCTPLGVQEKEAGCSNSTRENWRAAVVKSQGLMMDDFRQLFRLKSRPAS
jgi:hypothetical protein